MKFYRVCHRDVVNPYGDAKGLHVGPYSNCELIISYGLQRMMWAHQDVTHPGMRYDVDWPGVVCDCDWDGPCECDERVINIYDYACGFTSLEALKTWFRGFRTMLRREDFVMRVFEVSDECVLTGSYQAVCEIAELRRAPVNVLAIP